MRSRKSLDGLDTPARFSVLFFSALKRISYFIVRNYRSPELHKDISDTKLTFWPFGLILGFDCLKTHLSLRCLIQHKLLTIDHRLRTQDVFPYIDVFKFSDVYNVWKMSIFACKHLIKHNKWHLTSNRRDINLFPKRRGSGQKGIF